MGRPHRAAEGGTIYHVLNRANARMTIFEDAEDFAAFEKVLIQAVERSSTRLLAYCLMPNHWHLIVWPHNDGELSRFIGWLTLTHTQRWHAHRHSSGSGHVYQGRFKSFPIQDDEHFHTVARYVERNALRAKLVAAAEQWRWGSLYRWRRGIAEDKDLLVAWPLARKPNWVDHVNAPQTEAETAAVRRSVERGRPFGDESWCERAVRRLGLESTLRPHGRPKNNRFLTPFLFPWMVRPDRCLAYLKAAGYLARRIASVWRDCIQSPLVGKGPVIVKVTGIETWDWMWSGQ